MDSKDHTHLPEKFTVDSEDDKPTASKKSQDEEEEDDHNKNTTDENEDPKNDHNKSSNARDQEDSKVDIVSSPKSPPDYDYITAPDANEPNPEPSSPPDLTQVSEEIDNFISSLLKFSQLQEHDEDNQLPDVPICVEQFVVLVEAKVRDYEPCAKWSQLAKEDSDSFIESVNRLSSLSNELMKFSTEDKYTCSINIVGGVLQCAMLYLEEEFKSLLEDHQEANDPSPNLQNQDADIELKEETIKTSNNIVVCGYSDQVLSDLIRISKAMVSGGHESECRHVYFVARRNFLEERLHKLGFGKHSIDDVVHKMKWETLEREIESWIRIFRQFTSTEFPLERKLSDAVFSEASEDLFGSVAHEVLAQLLNFAQAVALTKRAAEKLFKFIDVYEALRDDLPPDDTLFPDEMLNQIKTEASTIRSRLGEAMILIFAELESSIKSDTGKSQVPGGAVHPLTKYTMNYLEYACEYKNTLGQVFGESGLQTQVTKVLDLLDSNMEGKARLYKDASLKSIFMMNNGRYMLKKIKGKEVNGLIGDGWYRRKSSDMRQYHKGYQRETWGKLLGCLTPEGLTVNGKVVKPVLKERFKSFNVMFDEIHKTQSGWVVGDEQLQSELRVSISNMVIPAYRSFLGRYSQIFTPGRQMEKYVKYQAEDIETHIDELFDGTVTPMGRKKQ
ncbi:exocyst subunit exo70 family protein C2 [Striga hermonthica]|uniref:Exocyst subunit Exo70 family protein n=1 Tax=Striga hermonthica TaxID=68872 RepID=A0A9N7N4Y9_STRHE|nr:exocyst subunit exo70 family protein C2 [Striga hermonthica]